jgi:hypothetical protein
VQDHIDGDIVGRLEHAMGRVRNSQTGTPTPALSPWSSMSYSNRVNELKNATVIKCHGRLTHIFNRLPVEASWSATQNAEWLVMPKLKHNGATRN